MRATGHERPAASAHALGRCRASSRRHRPASARPCRGRSEGFPNPLASTGGRDSETRQVYFGTRQTLRACQQSQLVSVDRLRARCRVCDGGAQSSRQGRPTCASRTVALPPHPPAHADLALGEQSRRALRWAHQARERQLFCSVAWTGCHRLQLLQVYPAPPPDRLSSALRRRLPTTGWLATIPRSAGEQVLRPTGHSTQDGAGDAPSCLGKFLVIANAGRVGLVGGWKCLLPQGPVLYHLARRAVELSRLCCILPRCPSCFLSEHLVCLRGARAAPAPARSACPATSRP